MTIDDLIIDIDYLDKVCHSYTENERKPHTHSIRTKVCRSSKTWEFSPMNSDHK